MLEVANLRVGGNTGPTEGSIEGPSSALAELMSRRLIRHIGVSDVTPNQFTEALKISPIVCVQNFYNVAKRHDDEFIGEPAKLNIPSVPFFPLGGFTPLQSSILDWAATALEAKPMQLALASAKPRRQYQSLHHHGCAEKQTELEVGSRSQTVACDTRQQP